MKPHQSSLSDILNYRFISDNLCTAGQPSQQQFELILEAGFEAVINLALLISDNALDNEGSIVAALGMAYVQLPVNFKAPSDRNFHDFCHMMDLYKDRKVFVHCAANLRVSAFVYLYRVLRQNTPVPEAEGDLLAIWQPNEVWTKFMNEQLYVEENEA
jgi:protein tyrosine phosphatase (PTP) superfamily phosphohydrolase (DUF442 family)